MTLASRSRTFGAPNYSLSFHFTQTLYLYTLFPRLPLLTSYPLTQMLIGIGGISRSGKTKFSRKVSKWLRDQGHRVIVFHQDDFVKPEDEIPMIRDHIDWEVPESMDWGRWDETVQEAIKQYDFVIAEGLFAFWERDSSLKFDRKILVEVSDEVFFARKREDLRWGREPEWFIQHIWDNYLIYGKPDGFDGLVISGEQRVDAAGWQEYLQNGFLQNNY